MHVSSFVACILLTAQVLFSQDDAAAIDSGIGFDAPIVRDEEAVKRAEAGRKLEEMKKTEATRRLEFIKQVEESKKKEEEKKQAAIRKKEDSKKELENKKLEDVRRRDDVKKIEEARKLEEAKKAEEESTAQSEDAKLKELEAIEAAESTPLTEKKQTIAPVLDADERGGKTLSVPEKPLYAASQSSAEKESETISRGSAISTTAGIKSDNGSSYTPPVKIQPGGGKNEPVVQKQPEPEAESPKIVRKGAVTLLLGRAINASAGVEDQWVSAIIETALEYKLAAISDLILVNTDTIRAHLPSHGDLNAVPEDSDYLDLAKRLKADYVGIQKFEVGKDKSVFYYMEIMSVQSREMVSTIERTFKVKKLGTEIDEITSAILREFTITPPRDLARFLRLPVVGEDLRANKLIGDCIVRDRFSRAIDSVKLAADYRTICERERDLPIAYYRAGFFFFALGKYSDASEAFNLLFLSVPEYTPIYIPLSRAFRRAKRQQDAVRIAQLGEKRGISGSELISEKAMSYLEMGKQNEAEDAYKQILAKNPNDPFALVFYAQLNNDAKKPKEALAFVDKLMKGKMQLGNAYLQMGRSLLLMDRNSDAVGALTKSVAMLPNEVEPVLYLGDAYLAAKQYRLALELFENALQKTGENIDLYLKAAFAADKAGNNQKALSILKSVEQRFSNHGGLQKEMGLLELANGDSANARIHLEASMRAGIEDERVLIGLGWMYVNAGETDKAATMFTKALTFAKDKNACKVGLAMVYIKQGDTKRAMPIIEEVASAKIVIPGINGMLGDAMLAKGEKNNALLYYRKERSLGTEDRLLQEKIAKLSYELEPPKSSRAEYELLIKKGGGGTVALYRVGLLALSMKDMAAAQQFLENAIKSGDTDVATWLSIGKGYVALSMPQQALDAFKRCAQKDPSKEDVWLSIADLQSKLGNDSATAEAHLKLYGINAKKYEKNLAAAGHLFEKTGQKEKARSTYTTFVNNKHLDANVNISLAAMEYESKNYTAVISLLQTIPALTLGIKYGKMLVESYFTAKQYEKALPLIDYIIANSPRDLQAIEWGALANEYTKQIPEAIKLYQKYLLVAGNHQNYAFHLGELLEHTGKMDAAITQYKLNSKSYPSDARNYNRLAAIYVDAQEWKSAITMLEKSLTFEAASPKILGLLAKANMALGKKKEAMEYLRNYIKNSPNDSSAWYELGMLYYNSKQFVNAAKALLRAGELMKRTTPEVNKLIGISYLESADTLKATAFLENARSADKGDKEVLGLLITCYRYAKDAIKLSSILSDFLRVEPTNDGARMELAELYLSQAKFSDATKLLEEALRKRTCDVPLHLKLASVYEKQNDQKQWLLHLQEASKCDPKNAEMLFQIGRYYFELQNKLQAERYLKKALQNDKKLPAANYMLGSILLGRKEYKSAGVFLSRAVAIDLNNVEYRIALTEAFYKQERFEDAFKVIRPVVRAEKIRPDALRLAGLLFKAMGNPDTAKQILENALTIEKSCSECLLALGDLYFDEGDYANASDRYQRAFNMSGFSKDAALRLAHSYQKMEKPDQARELYEKVIAQSPGDGEALFRLINIYLSKNMIGSSKTILSKNGYNKNGWYYLSDALIAEAENNLNAAVIAYAKALKLMPEVPEVQAGCGRISLAKKKYAGAIKYFGLAMATDPSNIDLMFGMGQAYVGMGDQATALELFQEVARQKPEYPGIHHMIARIYSKSGDHENAIRMLEEGAKVDRKNAQLFIALGHEYRQIDNSTLAIENYSKAIKIDELKSVEAYRYIGNIYYKGGNEKKAKKYYANYIKLGGKNKKIRKYMSTN